MSTLRDGELRSCNVAQIIDQRQVLGEFWTRVALGHLTVDAGGHRTRRGGMSHWNRVISRAMSGRMERHAGRTRVVFRPWFAGIRRCRM